MKPVLKKTLIGFSVVLSLLILGGCYFVYRGILIGSAYTAKVLCSSVFISDRNPQSVFDEDLKDLGFFRTRVDYEGKSVTSSFYGLGERHALFREGLGCTLLLGSSEQELRAQVPGNAAIQPPLPEGAVWPAGDRIPETSPPLEVDRDRIESALDLIFREPDPERPLRTRAAVVVYKGNIVGERYAPGFSRETPLLGWSMTKSVTNALVGALVGQGKLSIEDKAAVPEWNAPGDPRGEITLDQLLRMSGGLEFWEVYDRLFSDPINMLLTSGNTGAFAANKPLEAEPDSRWSYSSGTTNIISRLVRDTVTEAGEDYFSFPRRELFERIGMRSAILEPDASGTFVGSSFMYATARDWARFGLLYLWDGVWEGTRILPEGWVEYSTTPTPMAPRGRYGAQFWLNAGDPSNTEDRPHRKIPNDAFFADGFEGQNVTVIPSRELVIVRLGCSPNGWWNQERFTVRILESVGYPTEIRDGRMTR